MSHLKGVGRPGPGRPQVNRREVLRTAGIGGAGLGAAAFLAACGSSGKQSTGNEGCLRLGQGAGVVRVLGHDRAEQPDPSLESEFDGMLIIRNTYDALTFTDETTKS